MKRILMLIAAVAAAIALSGCPVPVNPTYTVTYNANGATGGTPPVDTAAYAEGQTVTVLGNTGGIAKHGFSFAGWNTQADGGGTDRSPGSAFAMGAANVTLYAKWTSVPTYSVTYDANGAASGSPPVDGKSYVTGELVTILANSGSLAKAGYTFVGWNTLADGNGENRTPGLKFTMGTANVRLYAKWTSNPTYSVTYDANGATGGSPPADSNKYYTGQAVVVLANAGNLIRSGYSFAGWNTAANGSGTDRSPGTTFVMGTASVTLYAKWTSLPTYRVTYSANGATSGAPPVDSTSYLQGQTVVVLQNTGNLAREGYSFAGWNTQANGGGTDRAPGSTFAMGSASVILYAKWTALPTYSVTYSGNGSTGGSPPTDSTSYLEGQIVTVKANTGNLVKSGYSFAGWNTQANGNGTDRTPGSSFTMGSSDVTLYAKWTALPTYRVTYDSNGATGGSPPTDSTYYLEGQTVLVLANTGSLVKSGYSFAGWNTMANGSGTDRSPGTTFAMGTASVILYAKWTSLPTYSVTYNANGATGGIPPVDATSYLQGQTVVVLANTGSLAKEGYNFAGWNTQANGGGTDRAPGSTFTMGSASVTLYAKWTALPTYSVTYSGNGATGGSPPVDPNSYVQGQTVTVLANTGNLVRSGYTFVGWNTQANGSGTDRSPGSSFTMGSADVTLYAKWTALPTYRVTYNANGATGGSPPTDSTSYLEGQTVLVMSNTGNLVKSGYSFAGWNTLASGSGTDRAPGSTFAMGSASVTLYAKWTTLPTYSVIYSANGATGGTPPVDSTSYLEGQTVTVKANTGNLVKSGYSFVGWNTQANGGGTDRAPGSTFAMGSASVTLYAKWSSLPAYSVIYNANGATSGSPPVDAGSYAQGQTVTVLANTGNLAKLGYTFACWNTQANGGGTDRVPGSSFAMGSADVTLYAKWSVVSDSIVYNFEDGTFSNLINTGDALWTISSTEYHGGSKSARTGAIGNSQYTDLRCTGTVPAGKTLSTISFWVKTSTASSDYLTFWVYEPSVDQYYACATWSGEVAWTQKTLTVNIGQGLKYDFDWEYIKDETGTSGQDAAWIDDIQLTFE